MSAEQTPNAGQLRPTNLEGEMGAVNNGGDGHGGDRQGGPDGTANLNVIVARARQQERDRIRGMFGTPIPDRTNVAAPGDDGYESSDVEGPETDAVGANAVLRGIAQALAANADKRPQVQLDQGTWKAKADYKRALDAVDKRARNIRHSLNSADGIVGDAAFWSQLRDTIQGDDFRQAVVYAETLTNELGEQRPAAEGTVSALQFDAMVKGYMTEHHTPNYLDVARDVLMETVGQTDGETGAAYRLRELQRYKGIEYLFKDPSVGERERKVMYTEFVAVWIRGLLDTDLAGSLAEKYETSKLEGEPWKLETVVNRVTARERNTSSPTKRKLAPPKVVAPHHSQTPLQAGVGSQAPAAADPTTHAVIAAAVQAAVTRSQDQANAKMEAAIAAAMTKATTALEAAMLKNEQGGGLTPAPPAYPSARPSPPPVCRTCERDGNDPHHSYAQCPHYKGCYLCGGRGHYKHQCTAPCPDCGQTSVVNGKRHAIGCPRVPKGLEPKRQRRH
jgi:hypothetical protein